MNLLIFSMFTLWSYYYGFALDCMHLHKCRCVCWCFCLCALVIRLVKNALPTSQLALAASSLTLAHYFAKLQSLLLLLLPPPPVVVVAAASQPAFLSSILTIFTAFICCCWDAMLRSLSQLLLFFLCRSTGLPRFFLFVFGRGCRRCSFFFPFPLSIHTFLAYEWDLLAVFNVNCVNELFPIRFVFDSVLHIYTC